MYRRIAQAWRDADREREEIIQLEIKIMTTARGNKKDF